MNKSHVHVRVACAAAAVVLTALSSTVFVSAEPTNLDRGSAPARTAAADVSAELSVVKAPAA